MRSLHDEHEMNAYRTGYVFLSDCLNASFNSRTAELIYIKFFIDVKPLRIIPKPFLSIFYTR
jgi:hypothetical protein